MQGALTMLLQVQCALSAKRKCTVDFLQCPKHIEPAACTLHIDKCQSIPSCSESRLAQELLARQSRAGARSGQKQIITCLGRNRSTLVCAFADKCIFCIVRWLGSLIGT